MLVRNWGRNHRRLSDRGGKNARGRDNRWTTDFRFPIHLHLAWELLENPGERLSSLQTERSLVSIGHVRGDGGGNGERGCVGHDAPVRIDVRLDGNRDRQMDGKREAGRPRER